MSRFQIRQVIIENNLSHNNMGTDRIFDSQSSAPNLIEFSDNITELPINEKVPDSRFSIM